MVVVLVVVVSVSIFHVADGVVVRYSPPTLEQVLQQVRHATEAEHGGRDGDDRCGQSATLGSTSLNIVRCESALRRVTLRANVRLGLFAERRRKCVNVTAIDANVRRPFLLRRGELASKPRRRRSLWQSLHIEIRSRAPATNDDKINRIRARRNRRARERQRIRRPQLITEEGRVILDDIPALQPSLGRVPFTPRNLHPGASILAFRERQPEGLIHRDADFVRAHDERRSSTGGVSSRGVRVGGTKVRRTRRKARSRGVHDGFVSWEVKTVSCLLRPTRASTVRSFGRAVRRREVK